jgi:NTP pyrophosphohydrolases containing a Zn-finger, probably nucleic-acid-binding
VGRGWATLIERIFDNLPEAAQVLDVKEKFGALRVSVFGGNEAFSRLVQAVQVESTKTCEKCGEPGVLRQGGWTKTLCNRCAKGRAPLLD